ncbi:MAG: NAD(P)-dependent oxidoreductase [Thermoguttaceae bacterium]|nr:NAD(P)-dependent oxidoreductase [Thermoguttaceae bacterium]MDW8038315.1 NAD(P)-dependent oxidoreductase [Thermoguttaceae bacterium]
MSHWTVEPGKTRLGWIGTGVMGRWMAGHLLQAGYHLTIYNRTRSKAEPLLQAGAQWAESPRQVAEVSDVIFTMVGFPADVRQVILGPEGVLAGCSPGKIIVDMTTSQPALAVEIAQQAAQRGVVALDAPVTGGDVGAREAKLSIMIGGDPEAAQALRPCFECMGKTIVYHGPAGSGQHAKLANQIVIASQMVALCEGLLYAYKAGLDLQKVLQSVGAGSASSWSVQNLGPRILAGNFDPGFFVEHFIKDMAIALEEARRMGLALPGLALAHQLYMSVQALGHGRKGTHALQLALAAMSGIDWTNRPPVTVSSPWQKT